MRAVFDTHVLVSGIINPHGPPGRIVDAILSEAIIVLHDDRILSEYREVLMRPIFGFEPTDVEIILDFIEVAGEHISAKEVDLILPDPTDLPFLEVAVAGVADALVTGNRKHSKPKRGKHNVDVCGPAEFLRRLA
jgi:putative PIN family toxin of toxin-antitoxin system